MSPGGPGLPLGPGKPGGPGSYIVSTKAGLPLRPLRVQQEKKQTTKVICKKTKKTNDTRRPMIIRLSKCNCPKKD